MDPGELSANGTGSLAGLTAGRLHSGLAWEIAAWLLRKRGATILETTPATSAFAVLEARTVDMHECAEADLVLGTGRPDADAGAHRGGATALLRAAPIACPSAGIPVGTLDYATGAALATAALASWRGGHPIVVSELGVAIQVFLPEVMAVSYGSHWWPIPPGPVPAPGGGWLSKDLGAEGDDELYAGLLATLSAGADAATIAAAAQEWRLAVCEYRRRVRSEPEDPIWESPAPAGGRERLRPASGRRAPLADISICDLTAMWAGPLGTWLLARLGAKVYKVEPAVRLDGTRALFGGGIYPGGIQRRPGEDSALYQALNHGKTRVPLDLRVPLQRDQFLALARRSDVVIDSFTPRVMPNFGLSPDVLNSGTGRPVVVSMPAFGRGEHRDWVAFGTGVHALSGLGDGGDGTFSAPSVAYPDVVAGLTAAFAVVAALVGRDRGRPPRRVEIPLMPAIQPLLAFPAEGGLWLQEAGGVLYDAGLAASSFRPLEVAGMRLMHPNGPFRVTAGAPEPGQEVVAG